MMFRDSLEGLGVGAFLTALVYGIGMWQGWITPYLQEPTLMFGLEVVGVFLNFACVWLVVRQKMANWWIGIVASALLGIFFFKLNLLASATLSLAYFVPIQVWGWWNWKNGMNADATKGLNVGTMDFIGYVQVGLLGLVAWYFISQLFVYFGAALAPLDTGILVLSVMAQYLLGWKRIESWALWFAVNVLSIYVYGQMGAYLVAMQYAIFLLNAANGGYQWSKDLRKQSIPVKFGR
jgi:nicotinamide mononucleotide transporter